MFGKNTYHVNFDWQDVALETSAYIDAESTEEALEDADELFELPEGQAGTWSVEEAERNIKKS